MFLKIRSKKGEQIGDAFAWLAGGFFISLVLGFYMFFVFGLHGGSSILGYFQDDEFAIARGVDLEANRDFINLLGKRVVVDGNEIKVIDGIKRGYNGEGNFVEEGNGEFVSLVSEEFSRLCGYELEVDGGYFDESGFHKILLVEKNKNSQRGERELMRFSNQKGKFLLEPLVIIHRNVNKGEIVEMKFVKFMECKNEYKG